VTLFTSGGLGLVILVLILVLRIWSCLHHLSLLRYSMSKNIATLKPQSGVNQGIESGTI